LTNNRKIANSVFNVLRKEGLIPVDVQFGNGYFIFEYGEDSVVHFHIKGVKNWKFGMWINTSIDNAVQVFAQNEMWIDKFKPSRSIFLENISKTTLKRVAQNKGSAEYDYMGVVRMIQYIKNNPHLATVQDYYCGMYIREPLAKMLLDCKISRLKEISYDAKKYVTHELVECKRNALALKILKSKNPEIIKYAYIHDCNCDGIVCYPRYEVRIVFNQMTENDEKQAHYMNEAMKSVQKIFSRRNTHIRYFVGKESRDYEWYD